ncbi:MAG: dihydroneopterin aldolase [Akkermansiaceae bacterium]|jgi:FolB domain-containing protein|nr:dihydroneopterin aldolase [Akkermansiaceae bacterium]
MPVPEDIIEIRRLQVPTHIGVPDEERAEAQVLLLTIHMVPSQNFDGLADEISRTINYYEVAQEIKAFAASKPRRLIETLATETADLLLRRHPLKRVEVMIEKHILPDAECVAVRITREKRS